MANRIVNNTIIVDSATINLDFPGVGNYAYVQQIAFWSTDSTGLFELSLQSNTTNVVVKMASPLNQPNTINSRFPGGQRFEKLYVRFVTVGTGFIYLI